ncbi:MAG: hypothetical protein KY445_13805 [Armatimonadetes bacterium]|nr:hypothetical protein [Armatimonadota bacterium]
MPWNPKRYPPEWKAIRARIQERAGDKCEWCGVTNRAIGYREKCGAFVQLAPCKESVGMDVEVAALDGYKIVEIVCTTAHLGTDHADGSKGDKHDKMDCRDENLAFLCQRCHLRYDIQEHIENAARTRAKKREAAARESGQLNLI